MIYENLATRLDTSKYHIIDSHAHLGKYALFHIPSGEAEDLVAQMDKLGVSQIAISPMLGLRMDCVRSNDMTYEAMQKYPERIIGMATINPNRKDEIIPELERCFDKLGMSMIKLHPDETACHMDNPVYELVYDFASERGLAIMNHSWEDPKRMEKLAGKYPNVRFIQAHSAGNWDGHRVEDYFRVARECPNAYVDLVASPVFYDALEKTVELVGEDKILFGSDAPFLNLGFELGKILLANISHTAKEKILAKNFQKIIGV